MWIWVPTSKQRRPRSVSNWNLPGGYSVQWSGQYEYMLRAQERLSYVVPLTLAIIVLLLYLNFRRFAEVMIILATLPVAALGGVWLMIALGYNFSIAVGVGFIALAGVAVEIGIIMLVYLNQAYNRMVSEAQTSGSSTDARRTSIGSCSGSWPSRATGDHDGCHNRGRTDSDHDRHRYRFGSHAAHSRTHGRRHAECDRPDTAGDSGRVFPVETPGDQASANSAYRSGSRRRHSWRRSSIRVCPACKLTPILAQLRRINIC